MKPRRRGRKGSDERRLGGQRGGDSAREWQERVKERQGLRCDEANPHRRRKEDSIAMERREKVGERDVGLY